MCGIAGFVGPSFGPDQFPGVIMGMLGHIGHRGPDGLGYVIDDSAGMGVARLAIIDPAGANQPMADATGRFWLCYNGEVYNYLELKAELQSHGVLFTSESDTEVVLQSWLHWGPSCLARFNGGFAFALYDRLTGRLVLARDRYGKRPLHYVRQGRGLCFASEMKSFAAVPGFRFEQDPAQLASMAAIWTPLPHESGFRGIEALPMAEWLEWNGGQLSRHRYESLDFAPSAPCADAGEARERIRGALSDSVRLRLRSSVEVGVYLSGGVDSAIVARLASRQASAPLKTFSISFADKAYDESREQRLMADFIGSEHHDLPVDNEALTAACPAAVYHAEVPAFRSAFIPMYLLSRLSRDRGIKVVLSGEGADEAFLGYDLFKEVLLRRRWAVMDEDERRRRLGSLYPHLSHFGPDEFRALLGLYSQFTEEKMPGLFSHELRFQNGRFAARLFKDPGNPFGFLKAEIAGEAGFGQLDDIQKAQWLEFRTLLSGYLLSTQGERMALAHGVENRCPFLDPSVVALASAVNLKFDDGFSEKKLLRDAFREDLPRDIVEKRKFPYRAPDSAAFADRKPDYLELLLSEAELAKVPFINGVFARKLVQKIMAQEPGSISTKEDQAFMMLLGIMLLDRQFVRGEMRPAPAPPPPRVRCFDLRSNTQDSASHGNRPVAT